VARFRRPSPALLIALAALFVALGGTVYATTLAPSNSVNSAAVINGQIKSADLNRGAIPMVTDHNSFHVTRGNVNSGAADCPKGTHVVSGGYVIRTDTIAYPIAAFPSHQPPEGYHVTVVVPPQQVGQPTDDADVDVIVYCAKGQLTWIKDL
jgi:hypothetical protein